MTANWDSELYCWELYLSKAVPEKRVTTAVGSETSLLHADHVWLATGSTVDVACEPLFSGLMAAAPAEVVRGLPVLTPDLR